MPEDLPNDIRCKQICRASHSKCCFVSDAHKPMCEVSRRRQASPLTCIAICILIIVYTILGAILFLALEGTLSFDKEESAVAASKPNLSHSEMSGYEIRSKTVEKLWSITEDLNILYKENWTRLAAKELMEFQRILIKSLRGGNDFEGHISYYDGVDTKHKWTFATSFLYALTLITTIGYGNVTPKTPVGKLAAVAYACVGIPITMVYLSTVGDALARTFRALYSKTCRPRSEHAACRAYRLPETSPKDYITDFSKSGRSRAMTPFRAALNLDSIGRHYHWKCPERVRVPILLCIFLIVLYVATGAIIFYKTEKWSLLDGCYFAFSSLVTIGFGDMYPGLYGSTVSYQTEDIAIGVVCVYILFGILVIAMCFNLIQDEITTSLRKLTNVCGATAKSRAVRDCENECTEDIAMSMLS